MAPTSSASQNPHVALVYPGWAPPALETTERFIGKPDEVIAQALMTYRLLIINHVKTELAKHGEVTAAKLLNLLDLAGQLYLGRFNALVGPVAVTQYSQAYLAAQRGEVPLQVIYALAEQHTQRMAGYFNETSKTALTQGFNTFVNQKVPARVAAERAMDAYGLTPRQMSGYTALVPEGKVLTALPRNLKARALDYIGRSIRRRFKVFATQEAHNLDMQAKQTAWMWMQHQGLIDPAAEKVWITAKDERVCKLCGPLHGKRATVTDQFVLADGNKIWVPGVHVNCRCQVRLVEPMIAKALDPDEVQDFNEEHPRDSRGRFSETTQPQRARRQPSAPLPFAEPTPSPALEELLAQAEYQQQIEQLLGEEEEAPVSLHRTEEAASLDRSQTKLGRGQTSLHRATTSIREAARASLAKPVQPSSLATMAQKVSLRRHLGESISLGIQEMQTKPKPKKKRVPYRPTKPLDAPLYAVMPSVDMDSDGKFQGQYAQKWSSKVDEVAMSAVDMIEAEIADVYTDLMSNPDLIQVRDKAGNVYTGSLEANDLEDVIYTVAMSGGDPDSHWESVQATVTFSDEDGNPTWTEKMTYGQLAEAYGLTSDDFEVRVVEINDGHDSSLGQTEQRQAETRYGEEEWTITGLFGSDYSYTRQVPGYGPKVRFYSGWPDVEQPPYGDINEEDDYVEGVD